MNPKSIINLDPNITDSPLGIMENSLCLICLREPKELHKCIRCSWLTCFRCICQISQNPKPECPQCRGPLQFSDPDSDTDPLRFSSPPEYQDPLWGLPIRSSICYNLKGHVPMLISKDLVRLHFTDFPMHLISDYSNVFHLLGFSMSVPSIIYDYSAFKVSDVSDFDSVMLTRTISQIHFSLSYDLSTQSWVDYQIHTPKHIQEFTCKICCSVEKPHWKSMKNPKNHHKGIRHRALVKALEIKDKVE